MLLLHTHHARPTTAGRRLTSLALSCTLQRTRDLSCACHSHHTRRGNLWCSPGDCPMVTTICSLYRTFYNNVPKGHRTQCPVPCRGPHLGRHLTTHGTPCHSWRRGGDHRGRQYSGPRRARATPKPPPGTGAEFPPCLRRPGDVDPGAVTLLNKPPCIDPHRLPHLELSDFACSACSRRDHTDAIRAALGRAMAAHSVGWGRPSNATVSATFHTHTVSLFQPLASSLSAARAGNRMQAGS